MYPESKKSFTGADAHSFPPALENISRPKAYQKSSLQLLKINEEMHVKHLAHSNCLVKVIV